MDNFVQRVWGGLWEDFSDLPRPETLTRFICRLLIAAILGGALGYTREQKGKEAGLRTHMLVALGAALFVIVPLQSGMEHADLSRVIAGIITGIGFLGAGAILKLTQEKEIHGLTTAAGIWFTAAVGICVGMGHVVSAILGTIVALLILTVVQRIERRMHGKH